MQTETSVSSYWLDAGNLRREIQASEAQRNAKISSFADMIRKYEGPGRHGDMANDYAPENHYFEWVSLVLSELLATNPKVTISTSRPTVAAVDALAIESALNRWIEDTNYVRYLQRIGMAWSFVYGVGLTTVEQYGGDFDDPRQKPRVIYLDPEQFGLDPLARSWEESRFMFHRCAERKVDLLARAKVQDGWDMEALKNLATEEEVQGLGRPKADVGRDEISYWEVWVPELNDEDDEEHHGKILTIGVMSGSTALPKELRKPRRYYGPRWGPYTLFGAYDVPRSAWPMGALQAHEGQNIEVNLHARANSKSASRRKTIMVYDEKNKGDAAKIAKACDGEAVGLTSFEKSNFEIFESRGVTEDALAYEQWARARLERVSGLNERAKGDLSGSSTATADAIAARGASARMRHLEQTLYDGCTRQLRTVAWFYWHNDRIIEQLPPEAAAQIAEMYGDPRIAEGPVFVQGGGFQGSFDDMELRIEQYSMQRVDEATMQAKSLQMAQVIPSLAAAAVQFPFMPWDEIFTKVGKAMNWPELGKVDMEMLAAQSAMLMQSQDPMAPQKKQVSEGPKLSVDRSGPPRLQRPSEIGQSKPNGIAGYSSGRKASSGAKI